MTAGIFKLTDYAVATKTWRASPAHKALQRSKPTEARTKSRPELLVTWQDDLDLSKLKFLESTDFPCQRGVRDRRALAKRLLTFLYYHITKTMQNVLSDKPV